MFTNTTLGQHQFDGPHGSISSLLPNSGVYIITTLLNTGYHQIVDVGESENVQHRVNNHDRANSWSRHAVNGLYASVHYCDEFTRMVLERAVRLAYSPPCGDR